MSKNNKKGISLLEMMVVIVIVAVLVAIIVPTVTDAALKGRAATNAANLREVQGTLSALRVSDYDAFMTATKQLENSLGGAGGFIGELINAASPGLADKLSNALATITATNGTLSLDYKSTPIEISAPGSKEVKMKTQILPEDTQMQIVILENEIICMYGGYTAADFADLAEDGEYDGEIKQSDKDKIQCASGNHVGPVTSTRPHACSACGNQDVGCEFGAVATGGEVCQYGCGAVNEDFNVDWGDLGGDIIDGIGNGDICVTPDTLVTLANGSQKRVGDLVYGDMLKVWNFNTAAYAVAPVSLIIDHGENVYQIIELIFSDGTKLNFVGCHGAFNATLNEFVDIDANNVASFVGNRFVKLNGSGYATVKLVDYNVKTERNGSITLLAGTHHNAILNGMLTISPSLGCENLYEPFEVGADLRYDIGKMQRDIATYGQYTYEDFSDYVTYEQFQMWGMANMKVTVGKGYATYDGIVNLITNIALPSAAN